MKAKQGQRARESGLGDGRMGGFTVSCKWGQKRAPGGLDYASQTKAWKEQEVGAAQGMGPRNE